MLVRSLRNHFYDGYHKEGEEFDLAGPLYRHVEPVEPEKAQHEKATPAHDTKPDNKPDDKHDNKNDKKS